MMMSAPINRLLISMFACCCAAWFSTAGWVAGSAPRASPDSAEQRISEEQKLIAELVDCARQVVDLRMKEFDAGRGTLEFLYIASRHLLDAELDQATTKAERVKAWQAQLDRALRIEKTMHERFQAGRVTLQDDQDAQYHRLEAKIGLLRAARQKGN
jgi:hypothetical protein